MAAALPKMSFVVVDDGASWVYTQTADMDSDEFQLAKEAWRVTGAEGRAGTGEAARLLPAGRPRRIG